MSREALDQKLAESIHHNLSDEIAKTGDASMLVSGGSTPHNLFRILSQSDLAWEKVSISLCDERVLPDHHPDQNGKMIRKMLLQNKAEHANFIPLVYDTLNLAENKRLALEKIQAIPRPFTLVILGMGSDGHTASLFPDSTNLDEAMDLQNPEVLVYTKTKASPYQRISFTRAALLNTKNLYLHYYGEEKAAVYQQASKANDFRPFPIQGFINQDKVKMQVYTTE